MADAIDLLDHELVTLGRSALTALRTALFRDGGASAATCLQEAGYAGGAPVYHSFRAWLGERGAGAPELLEVSEFERLASEYLRSAGWGSIRIGSLGDAVATVDSTDWGEADPASHLDHPACHLTAGLFADFFGRVADAPLAVLEVECRSAGAERCRFLLGSGEVLQSIFQAMDGGMSYQDAVAAA